MDKNILSLGPIEMVDHIESIQERASSWGEGIEGLLTNNPDGPFMMLVTFPLEAAEVFGEAAEPTPENLALVGGLLNEMYQEVWPSILPDYGQQIVVEWALRGNTFCCCTVDERPAVIADDVEEIIVLTSSTAATCLYITRDPTPDKGFT